VDKAPVDNADKLHKLDADALKKQLDDKLKNG
jgi:hypothetical protein